MYFERIKAAARTLRFRLMLWNAGAVVLTGMAVLISVREGVRFTLIAEMDQVLREDLQEISLSFQGNGYDWNELLDQLNRKARGHNYHGWFVQFYDREGNLVWSSVNAPALKLPASGNGSLEATVAGHRIAHQELPQPVSQAATVYVGCSQEFVARDMSRLDRLVLLCGGIVLLVSPLGGYALALRATRPLISIIQTTARLRPQELHERLPIRGTGDELDHLALAFNALLDRIAHYLEQKRDFLANAAHELRTPLAALRSSVEVALGGERTVEEYNELLADVIDQCSALELLVNRLLLLAETESDRLKVHAETVPLDDVVFKTFEMFQGIAEFHNIRLHTEDFPELVVVGNRQHLRQVLNNLLDNAIKFTAAKYRAKEDSSEGACRGDGVGKGEITISLTRDAAHNQAVLVIEDNGLGIAPDHLPHLFQRFYRGDRSRGRDGIAGGTGLGLSICQAIVDAHGGVISLSSLPGIGTKVTVRLPLAREVLQPRIERRAAAT